MNATKNNIGKNQPSRRKRTAKTTLAVGRFRKVASKTKDSERNTERQTKIRTDNHASNGFLKCRFLPKQEEIPTVQDCKEMVNLERDFYKSLSNFSQQYNVEPMQTKDFGFPYSMALAMWDIKNKVKQVNEDWTKFKLVRNNQEILFSKEERYYTGTSLYYIPIVPLFQMLHDKHCKKNAQLLLSVCSYLYHIADVPYYRRQDSYLYWIYEMHEDWIEQGDEAEEDMQEFRREFKISKTIGDKIEKKLSNRKNMEMFEQRLNRLKVIPLLTTIAIKWLPMPLPFTRNIRKQPFSEINQRPNKTRTMMIMVIKPSEWKCIFRLLPIQKVVCTTTLKKALMQSSTNTEVSKNLLYIPPLKELKSAKQILILKIACLP